MHNALRWFVALCVGLWAIGNIGPRYVAEAPWVALVIDIAIAYHAIKITLWMLRPDEEAA